VAGSTTVVFETHSWSEDNDRGLASGWLPGRLSARGRELAAERGGRRRDHGLDAVFSPHLERAVERARIAFVDSGSGLPGLTLRECDYGRVPNSRLTIG
jgi:alpha-ribazole phosphatase/probable phosphoglycerate mutase